MGSAWPRRGMLVLTAALLGCAPAPHIERPNVVVVLVDSLRARQLGAYGYPRRTSPFIDSITAEGVLFERASSPSSYTRESVASLFVGRLPSSSGAIGWNAEPRADSFTLQRALRDRGYRTAMVSNSIMLRSPGFTRDFERTEFPGPNQMVSGGAPRAIDLATEIIRSWRTEPFYLYLHLLDPHGPYEPPARLRQAFPAPLPEQPVSLYDTVRPRVGELRADGFGPGEARFEDLVARYDAEIAHVDESLRSLFSTLGETGLTDRTLVVLTSDHGEEFLEHDFVEHGWTLYEESLHVPLIFWAPGRLAPARVEERVSTVDVFATLSALLGLPPPHRSDGHPLITAERDGWRPKTREGPILSELLVETRNLVRARVEGNWKYVAAWRWLTPHEREIAVRERRVQQVPPGFDLTDPFGEIVREALYDLAKDPEERLDVSAEHPERVARMRREMLDWMLSRAKPSGGTRTPSPPLTDEEREQLRALGYL